MRFIAQFKQTVVSLCREHFRSMLSRMGDILPGYLMVFLTKRLALSCVAVSPLILLVKGKGRCHLLSGYSNTGIRSGVTPGQWLVIPGAGGGLGHFAIQYAKAMGMRVIAIDGGDEKRDLCNKLGAEVFIDFKTTKDVATQVLKVTGHGAHGVIVTAATRAAYESAPNYLRPNGTVVAVGLPQDPTVLAGAPPMVVALRRLKIVGSVTGSLKDVEEALDFTARGLVRVSSSYLTYRSSCTDCL
jgi:D-arabinose 1-dehydrogenase-like Zn-dependent alcohol dehydrogenase